MLHKIDFSYTTFKPFNGYLLIKIPLETEVKSAGGIVVETKKSVLDRPCYGEVIASSVDNINAGDIVIYPNTDGLDCEFVEGRGFMLLKGESVIGTVSAR